MSIAALCSTDFVAHLPFVKIRVAEGGKQRRPNRLWLRGGRRQAHSKLHVGESGCGFTILSAGVSLHYQLGC
jgi:hypothetical protein